MRNCFGPGRALFLVLEQLNRISRRIVDQYLLAADTNDHVASQADPCAPQSLHLPLKDARDKWTESFEHVYVRAVLKKTRGNVTHAAEIAGVSRRFLQRLAARLGIKASEVGADPSALDETDE